tara:strand:+ start:599 stop:850 length:252 start_codon:yes stop_codon:yes gene_type:complete
MNTDDYEGHTEGPWDADAPLGIYLKVGQTISAADARLIAAAPDLLAEVKRLREQICTCDGDGIAGSAYAGHVRKCACVEGQEE